MILSRINVGGKRRAVVNTELGRLGFSYSTSLRNDEVVSLTLMPHTGVSVAGPYAYELTLDRAEIDKLATVLRESGAVKAGGDA